jgi:iron complex outermembrane recepter protein
MSSENSMNRHSVYKTAFASALLATCISAHAQSLLEEVVVSADFRQNPLEKVAASITVLDAELMARRNAQHLEDVLLNAPNVNFASGASRARFFQLRGIGERSQYATPLNPSVGLLIDGIDFTGLGAAAMLYDVEQVEVLMGPQGTRYGSNALAGLINLQTRQPTQTPEFGLQLQRENLNGQGLAGYASGPLGPNLLGRLSVQKLESDGHMYNTTLGRPTNTREETTLRGKLHWTMSDIATAEFTLGLVDIDNGYDAFSLDNNRRTRSDEPGFDRQKSRLVSVKISLDHFSTVDLELLAGLAKSDQSYGYDEDWTYAGFHPWEYASTDHYFRDHDTLSAEFRALSKPDAGWFNGRTSWVAGLYMLDQQIDVERRYTYLPDAFNNSFDIARTAFYMDTTTELTRALSLEAGFRVENFVATYFDSTPVRFSPSDVLAGGRVALNLRTAENALFYASVSRGYKTGGFNIDGTLDTDLREYGQENLLNYELGFKGSLFDDQLRTRVALFYMDRRDVQINSSTTRVREDGSAEFIDYTGNAAGGYNRGVELGAEWVSNGMVTLYGNLGLLDSEYQDFINSSGDRLDGRQQAHAPDWQYTIGTNVLLLADLMLDLNLQGRDAFYFSDSHPVRSNSYHLLNASLSWQWQNVNVRLWGRNLLDKDYFVRGFFFGNDPRDSYAAKGYTQLGEPLRYGVTLNLDF